ncbi:FAD:protein FMN transferase [Primorskyibacter sp. S187A]|uniref:FAD:protein FMN transferase n=1 Tax=Primorskyibacter sp. S187A TaxID=3415130 RepID=UPI003C7ED27D
MAAARWDGIALGAQASITLTGISPTEAAAILSTVEREITRLEGIFSLYSAQSELSRLNKTGHLSQPSRELLDVLCLSRDVWSASFGVFDPSIQTIWPSPAQRVSDANMGFQNVALDSQGITIKRAGIALTLNGIAQGFVTDRITVLLERAGFRDILVSAGETRALGNRPSGGPWRLGISDPQGQIHETVRLKNAALATSSPWATRRIDGSAHVIDPRNDVTRPTCTTVTIQHDEAAVADALSTAACLLSVEQTNDMLAQFPGAKEIFRLPV